MVEAAYAIPVSLHIQIQHSFSVGPLARCFPRYRKEPLSTLIEVLMYAHVMVERYGPSCTSIVRPSRHADERSAVRGPGDVMTHLR